MKQGRNLFVAATAKEAREAAERTAAEHMVEAVDAPCDICGDYHPCDVLEDGFCPACCDEVPAVSPANADQA